MLPSPLEILLKDQNILVIEGAAAYSRKVVDHFDASTYRNTFLNNQITIRPPGFSDDIESGTLPQTNTATLAVPGTITGTLVDSATFGIGGELIRAARIIGDDVACAIEPRPWKKPRTRVDFWDGAIGFALTTLAATLTNGSATVTVPDNSRLFPGQAISGTNIPTNTVIMSVPHDTRTTVILSNKATGSGDSTAVLTGSNWLGGYFEDESVGEGINAFILS